MSATLGFVVLGTTLAYSIYSKREDKRRRTEILREVASARDGRLDVGGFFGNPLLDFVVGTIEVEVSLHSVKHGRFTEYLVHLPAPGLPRFKTSVSGLTLVDDEQLVRRVYTTQRTARIHEAHGPKGRFESLGTALRLLQPLIESYEQVDSALDVLLELAQCDPYGLAVLRALPDADVTERVDGFVDVALPGPSRIEVGIRRREGTLRTCVRAAATQTLPADAATLVTPLGATLEETETELAIWWPSIEDDARRLTAAVEIMRRLTAGPSLGVFR